MKTSLDHLPASKQIELAHVVAVLQEEFKRSRAKGQEPFELLKRAYVEARYSRRYKISAEDLEALTVWARDLTKLVEDVRREWLEELRAKVG